MPEMIIVAGPNGAGKTTFAKMLLPRLKGSFQFINADEIESRLRTMVPIAAGTRTRAG